VSMPKMPSKVPANCLLVHLPFSVSPVGGHEN
jgi:hypothetical protein